MRYLCLTLIMLAALVGCGPPKDLILEMHVHYNRQHWASVTEDYADLGKPDDFNGVTYARIADAAWRVYEQNQSPAYLELTENTYERASRADVSLADEYAYRKGRILESVNQTDAALEAYQRALSTNPLHVGAASHAIRILLKSDRYAQAIQAGRQLMDLRRPLSDALRDGLMGLATSYTQSGQGEEALKVYRHLLAIGPAEWEVDVQYELARHYDNQGENGLARTTMRRVLTGMTQSHPKYRTFWQYLDLLERRSRQASNAPVTPPDRTVPPKVVVTPATKNPVATAPAPTPDNEPAETPRARAEESAAQAQVLADEGKNQEAITLLQEAVSLAPDWPAPAAKLAALLYKEGQVDEARRVLEEAIGHNRDDRILKQMLEQL